MMIIETKEKDLGGTIVVSGFSTNKGIYIQITNSTGSKQVVLEKRETKQLLDAIQDVYDSMIV